MYKLILKNKDEQVKSSKQLSFGLAFAEWQPVRSAAIVHQIIEHRIMRPSCKWFCFILLIEVTSVVKRNLILSWWEFD